MYDECMLELHRKLLGDAVRNEAFAQALKQTIVPGKSVVLDIGAGTGFLSFLARKMGAKECWLIESGDVITLAKALQNANNISHCHYFHGHSSEYTTNLRPDIIVSETLGNYALEENIIETMENAKRFRSQKTVMIPGIIRQYVAPVVTPRLYYDVNVWDRVGYDLDVSLAKRMSMQAMYVKSIMPSDILEHSSATVLWDTVDFKQKNDSIRRRKAEWNMQDAMTIFGFALWWECELIPGITLSTSPYCPPTHWEQIYLPILEPIHIDAGERLTLNIESDTSPAVKVNVAWHTTVWSCDNTPKAHQSLDMKHGYFPHTGHE